MSPPLRRCSPTTRWPATLPPPDAQTVRVTGPDGATVTLLAVDRRAAEPDSVRPRPLRVRCRHGRGLSDRHDRLVGSSTSPCPNPTTPPLYHYVATIDDGANGPTQRDQLVIGIGDVDTPVVDPIANIVGRTRATPCRWPSTSTDPNGDPITLDFSSTPDIDGPRRRPHRQRRRHRQPRLDHRGRRRRHLHRRRHRHRRHLHRHRDLHHHRRSIRTPVRRRRRWCR